MLYIQHRSNLMENVLFSCFLTKLVKACAKAVALTVTVWVFEAVLMDF